MEGPACAAGVCVYMCACACAIGMPRDSGRVTREGDDFQFYSTNANGRVPSGNFESNWLSDHRLRKQMSVDFVARHR